MNIAHRKVVGNLHNAVNLGRFAMATADSRLVDKHAVNLTDGLDTLAGGTAALAFAAYGVIAFMQEQTFLSMFSFTLVGALLGRLWPDLLVVLLVATPSIPVGKNLSQQLTPDLVLPLLAVVVSVLIGFRFTQAYARWWEARTLWGQLRNHSRSWKASLLTLHQGPALPQALQRLLRRQVLLVWRLTAELRPHPQPPAEFIEALQQLGRGLGCGPEAEADSQALLDAQARGVADAFAMGLIEPTGRTQLAEHLRDMLQAIGGLERIRAQPFPASLAMLSRLVVWLFAWLLFLRLESDTMTPALGNAVAFILMASYVAAERLTTYLDHPLGDPVFGLPQHHICARISGDLLGPDHPLARAPQGAAATVWS